MSGERTATTEKAADFVRRFTEYWKAPSVEGLGELLAEEVLLVAPMTPTTRTLADGRRAFARLFELIPDMTAEVHRWGATEEGVLIEFTLRGTAGGKPISWDAVDRIDLDEQGMATARISYFDSIPIALTVVRRPRVWPSFIRAQLRR
ncbi:MAG TPA: nuclear transport factor 2 family protein [Solirubrobacterales bacterium]